MLNRWVCVIYQMPAERKPMQIITNQFQKELKEHGNYQFPFLISYERLSRYETGSFLWHWHPEIEITLITSGSMVYHCNDRTFYPQKGDVLFCNSNAFHTGEMINSRDCEYTSVTFDTRLIYGYDGSLIHQKYVQPILQNSMLSGLHLNNSESWHTAGISLVREIIACARQRKPLFELEIQRMLLQFWKLLYLNCETIDAVSSADRLNYARIRRILEYIEENYSSKIYLEDIAAHIGLCKSECCRLFKRYMKVSLFEFLLEYRIEKSLDFLADPECSITETAEKAGFNDSNYYSKAFRKIKGCSPRQYRKRPQKSQ